MAYSGTLVTFGQASGVVVGTAEETEIGRISGLLSQVQPLTTKLLQKMAQFGRWLTAAILALAVLTFVFGFFVRDYGAADLFIACVGLAVAAIPEGLPAIVTITLAIGVQRMAKRHAIIRRLPAVEGLGSVTVVCTDKTGTLTRNEMTVKTVVTAEELFEVSGVGYEPQGSLKVKGKDVDTAENEVVRELARAMVLCNEASLSVNGGRWQVNGDPTEGALLSLAIKAGLDLDAEKANWPRVDSIPFESERRFMATLNKGADGQAVIYVKGAPERLLAICEQQRRGGEVEPLQKEYWQRYLHDIGSQGQRLLAVAYKPAATDQEKVDEADMGQGLVLLGLVGMIDPPSGESISAIRRCQSAGIRVKMITGDHVVTARAIGAQVGIGDGLAALAGDELEAMSADELREAVAEVDVFARVSPEHKLRIVQALQARGEVVSMTGDGGERRSGAQAGGCGGRDGH